jgi:hypothetical protein
MIFAFIQGENEERQEDFVRLEQREENDKLQRKTATEEINDLIEGLFDIKLAQEGMPSMKIDMVPWSNFMIPGEQNSLNFTLKVTH